MFCSKPSTSREARTQECYGRLGRITRHVGDGISRTRFWVYCIPVVMNRSYEDMFSFAKYGVLLERVRKRVLT